jgi:hypothetical protein
MPDTLAPRVPLIPPGTIVDRTAPEGWTHLIIKSLARMESGDIDQVPETVRELSGKFFVAILARVVADAGSTGSHGYRLDEVAVNLGTRIKSKDTIITPETQAKLGANLGFLERIALDRGGERLKNVRVVARTPTMAVIDGPAMMVREHKHRPVIIRYAILVNPTTGRLDPLLWAIAQDDRGSYQGMFGLCEVLPPNKYADRGMHVDASEFAFGLITENAVALLQIHSGQTQITFTEDVKRLAGLPRYSSQSAAELEGRLRSLVETEAKPGTE